MCVCRTYINFNTYQIRQGMELEYKVALTFNIKINEIYNLFLIFQTRLLVNHFKFIQMDYVFVRVVYKDQNVTGIHQDVPEIRVHQLMYVQVLFTHRKSKIFPLITYFDFLQQMIICKRLHIFYNFLNKTFYVVLFFQVFGFHFVFRFLQTLKKGSVHDINFCCVLCSYIHFHIFLLLRCIETPYQLPLLIPLSASKFADQNFNTDLENYIRDLLVGNAGSKSLTNLKGSNDTFLC